MMETIGYAIRKEKPYITLKKHPDIPTSIEFPLAEMHTDYFTNSISYMIAYALHIGVTEIDIHRVNMLQIHNKGAEYSFQKPNIEYWIGYARGKGVTVTVHDETAILVSHDKQLYGYNTAQRV